METPTRTDEQKRIAETLADRWGFGAERVFFPDAREPNKPWLGADELTHIARQSERFQEIATGFDTYILALNQVVHRARVIDREGRSYERIGIATLGEKLRGVEADEHQLAGSRAVVAALSTAGFNPLRISKPPMNSASRDNVSPHSIVFETATTRYSQLRQIHTLAEKLELIQTGDKRDTSQYKAFLLENYGVESCAGMNETERASVITALTLMERQHDEI
ncbi:MAG: hypothetical protein WBV94_06920 [Blastocatellia bacterium]